MRKDWKDELRESLEDYQVSEPEGLWAAVERRAVVPAAVRPGAGVRRVLVPLSAAAAAAAALFLVLRPSSRQSAGEFDVVPSGELVSQLQSGAGPEQGSGPETTPEKLPAAEPDKHAISVPDNHASSVPDSPVTSAGTESPARIVEIEDDAECDLSEAGMIDFEEFMRTGEDGPQKGRRRKIGLIAKATGVPHSESGAGNYGVLQGSDLAKSLQNLRYEDPAYRSYSSLVSSNLGTEVNTVTTHRQPVSFALQAEFMLTERLGLYGGLSYTRLVSDLTSGSGNSYHTVQKLDYLGIPLGLNFHIHDTRWFGVYASVGATARKCVSGSTVTTYSLYGEQIQGERLHVMDQPVIFSLDAALGAGIGLWRGSSLFVEPGLSWHVPDGGELDNIYRDRPLNFSLSVGIRTRFGN